MKRLLLLMAVSLYSASALCAPDQSELAAYNHDIDQLMMRIDAAQEAGDPSKLKTPEIMSLALSVSDEDKLLRSDGYPVAELPTLLGICNATNKVLTSLMMFGLKEEVDSSQEMEQVQARMVALSERNMLFFQDELREIQPFQIRCLARQVHPLSEFVASMPSEQFNDVRRQGLAQMRTGFVQMYTGTFQASTDNRYRGDYRLELLEALADSSDALSSALGLDTRKKLKESARVASGNAPEPFKDDLERIIDSLGAKTCEGLCTVR